jgi:AcrR family transcriptional regulator
MARKASSAASSPASKPTPDPRRQAVEALMRLVALRGWEGIELDEIAAEAAMELKTLRGLFPSKGAMLAGFARMIDDEMLADTGEDMANEPLRERLFDVMMRRIDALAPYKPALAKLMPALRRSPLELAAMNGVALNSWRYMLASAGIPTADALGQLRLQGTVLVFSRVLEAWFTDEDEGLARTMAVLDKELDKAGRIMGRLEDAHRLTAPLRGLLDSLCRGARPRRRARDTEGDAVGGTAA